MRALILLAFMLFPYSVQAQSLPIADPQMITALESLVPELPEWNCAELEDESALASIRRHLPMVAMECRHESSSISLLIGFDPDYASTTCTRLRRDFSRQPDRTTSGKGGFEISGVWVSERTGQTFLACSADQIFVLAKLEGAQSSVSGDKTAFDLFQKALLARDTSKVQDLASESKKRLDEVFSMLDAETLELDRLLARPDDWVITNSLLAQIEMLEQDPSFSLPALMRLAGYPTAGHTLSRGKCRIQMSLSASPEAMHDAALTFAKPRIIDGVIGSFWRNRKTERLHGKEALDGSRYQMVVDKAVVLRIDATGDCSRDDRVATSFYDAVKSEDLSRFRRD